MSTVTSQTKTTIGSDIVGDDMESPQLEGIPIVQNSDQAMTRLCFDKHATGEEALDVTIIETL